MDGDISHDLGEFANFPWDKLHEEQICIGRGGVVGNIDFNKPYYRPHISILFADGSCDCWEIPLSLMKLLDDKFEQGSEYRAMQIRQLIG